MSVPAAAADSTNENADTPTFKDSWPIDLLSGFLVFLIALPLCLGIAKASGFPPIAGILTAVLGGLICPWISNSELTIKGPAAGMIAIVLGAMTDFGYSGDSPSQDTAAYTAVLAVGVIAGVIQILLGLFKAGKLGDFFPTAAVHGLLASIGVIIMAKQFHVLLGVKPDQSAPLPLIGEIPDSLQHIDPHIAIIGITSLVIMFAMPTVKKFLPMLKRVPAQLIVLIVAIPLGSYYHVDHDRIYIAKEHANREAPADVLVPLPNDPAEAVKKHPDFAALAARPGAAVKWIILFCMVGTLESLLSAKAVDIIDPYKRKSNYDRDILAVGVANTVSAALGGLPMISEILRSSANKDNGARTRLANFFHGIFLLLCVILLGGLLRMIPLSALAAMLVYAGFRLASPKEFLHMYHIGVDQLTVFVATLLGVLVFHGGLLEGIGIGIAVKFFLHIINGVPISQLFKPALQIEEVGDDQAIVYAQGPAVFSNWIGFKSRLDTLADYKQVVIDLTEAGLVDHTVMDRLQQTQRDFQIEGRELQVIGLENHKAFSIHPLAARKKPRLAT